MASKAVREALRAKFPADQVKQRQGAGGLKLDYVAGETVINRLIDATKDEEQGYAWQSSIAHIEKVGDRWVAVVHGNLAIQGDIGTGVGAMENRDVDMAVKSANTEALKNAAKNGFGVALELWDKEYRETLGQQRRALAGSEAALKSMVFDIAKNKLDTKKPTAAQVATLFDVSAGDLSDAATLRTILEDQGVL
jgi:sugar phosphate isomerase/epimerase